MVSDVEEHGVVLFFAAGICWRRGVRMGSDEGCGSVKEWMNSAWFVSAEEESLIKLSEVAFDVGLLGAKGVDAVRWAQDESGEDSWWVCRVRRDVKVEVE